ncbi:hypothetical protein M407DRAFT_28597 [Tulasnella calospora MUT 4182]|uniref:Uncharacterized protein n=1 Tax=Tulasnella calospora MUT 4182 TaxID=1051891 RepID=A0A0C3QBR7_9AGAM|nr:hypothetical protein M407DRAFT_28597 [Tulasnella calospora MUT 4182]
MTVGSRLKSYYKKFNSTVINDMWPEQLFFSSVAVAVCCINQYTKVNFTLNSTNLLTVLGTVLGLVISFRTTSAYDRFWEGRQLWGKIALASRTLGMIIWIHVPIKRKVKDGENVDDIELRAIIEKKSMMNLIQAFSVSVKHFLRAERGIYYKDLYPLLCFLPQSLDGSQEGRYAKGSSENESDDTRPSLPMWQESPLSAASTAKPLKGDFDPEVVLPTVASVFPLAPARNPPKETIYDIFPPFIIFLPIHLMIKKLTRTHDGDEHRERNIFGKKRKPEPIESNIPLEISLFLSSYMAILLRDELLDPAMATAYDNALVSMQEAVISLQRIRSTPIPFAYQFHLRVSVWLFLLFLPIMIYSDFKWLTIPCTAFACFLYVGILEIGQGIENPFNYSENALELEYFCHQIQRELAEIAVHPAPDPSGFIFSQFNQPFAPSDRRTAIDILRDNKDAEGHEAIPSVRHTLARNYQEVFEATSRKNR